MSQASAGNVPERRSIAAFPWYPTIVAAAYVLNLWIESGVSLLATTRSLAVAIGWAVVLLILFTIVTRRPHVSGALAVLVLAIAASRGLTQLAALLVLSLAVPAALVLWARIQGGGLSWPRATRAANALTVLVLIVVLAGGIPRGTYAAAVSDLQQGVGSLPGSARTSEDLGLPDIFVLLLDGYPRADAMARLFDADNQPFIDGLNERGFQIAQASRSNYPSTQPTLTSMLHMQPLHELSALQPVIDETVPAHPLLRLTLNRNPVFDELRERGHTVIASSPGYEHVTLRQADVFLDDGSLNETERHLIRSTPIQWAVDTLTPGALGNQHRERVLAGFTFFKDAVARTPGPTFAFIHIPSPHLPVVIDREGALLESPVSEEAYRRRPLDEAARRAYVDQLLYLNGRALESIDFAMDREEPGNEAVIVVLSDHGALPPALPGEGWAPDHFSNFIAVRMPPNSMARIPDEMSPVNLFPIVFNAEFGTDYPLWPNERYPWPGVRIPGEDP